MAENIIVSQDNLTISIPEDDNIYALFLKESGTGSFQLVETTSGGKFGFEWTLNSLPLKGAAAAIIQYDEEPENPTFDSSKTYATVTFQYPVTLSLDIPANGLYVGETLGYSVEPSSATLTFSEEIFTDGVLTQLPHNDIIVTASADGYDSVEINLNKAAFKQHKLSADFMNSSYKYGDSVTFIVKDEKNNDVSDANFSAKTGSGFATISKEATGYSFTINKVAANSLSIEITKQYYESVILTLDSIGKIPTSFNCSPVTYPNNIVFAAPKDGSTDIAGTFKIDSVTVTSPISNYAYSDYNNKTLTFIPTSEIYESSTNTISVVKGTLSDSQANLSTTSAYVGTEITITNTLGASLSFSSSSSSNITLNSGKTKVSSTSYGEATLIFTKDGYNPKSIVISYSQYKLKANAITNAKKAGTTQALSVKRYILDKTGTETADSATPPSVTWTSSDTSVAILSGSTATYIAAGTVNFTPSTPANYATSSSTNNVVVSLNTFSLQCVDYILQTTVEDTIKAVEGSNALNVNWTVSGPAVISASSGSEIKIRATDDNTKVILTASKQYYQSVSQEFSVNPHIADVYQEIHSLYEEIQKLNLSLNTLANTTVPTQISEATKDLASKSSVTSITNWAKAMEKYFVMPTTETKITK